MKPINYLAHKILAGAVAAALVALAFQASAESIPQVVTVIKVKGHARYSTDGQKTWSGLNRGDILQPGAIIQTSTESTVDIVLGQQSTLAPISGGGAAPSPMSGGGGSSADSAPTANIVRIFPSSTLGVDKLILDRTGVDEVSETQLDLRAGRIMGNVKKLSAASRYEVKLPNGVAGVRGTGYMLDANGVLYVVSGQVILTYVGSNGQLITQTVSAGQSFDPFWDPSLNNGKGGDGTTPGPGLLSNIPPSTLQNLITDIGNLREGTPPVPKTYVENNIIITTSPSGGVPNGP